MVGGGGGGGGGAYSEMPKQHGKAWWVKMRDWGGGTAEGDGKYGRGRMHHLVTLHVYLYVLSVALIHSSPSHAPHYSLLLTLTSPPHPHIPPHPHSSSVNGEGGSYLLATSGHGTL